MLKKLLNGLALLFGAVLVVLLLWSLFIVVKRPFRQPLTQQLYQGVSYERRPLTQPRSMMVHIVEIDYSQPNVSFLATQGTAGLDGDNDFLALKTSSFLKQNGLQLAINGDFFSPFESNHPLSYYPHEGDPVSVAGFSIANGEIVAEPEQARPVFCVLEEKVQIASFICPPDTLQAISGNPIFFENGALVDERLERIYFTLPAPRTIIATDDSGTTAWFIIIDGRQRSYSGGATLAELVPLLTDLGATTALNLDGGGSVTLAMMGENGRSKLLNAPIHTRIPLRERPVANHIGVYAEPAE